MLHILGKRQKEDERDNAREDSKAKREQQISRFPTFRSLRVMQDEYSFEFIPSSSCAALQQLLILSFFPYLSLYFFFVWSKQVDGGVRKERKRDFSFFCYFFCVFFNLSSYSRPSLLLVVVVSFRIGSS